MSPCAVTSLPRCLIRFLGDPSHSFSIHSSTICQADPVIPCGIAYMGANIPGKPREQLVYLGGVDVYAKEIRSALDGWKGFTQCQDGGK